VAASEHDLDESHSNERVDMAGIKSQGARKKRPRAD
jgi:hypothetical protein